MEKRISKVVKLFLKSILEVLYPKRDTCIICQEEDIEGICSKCKRKITFCKEDELCIGYYAGTLKELILKFKYYRDFEAGEVLIDLILKKILDIERSYLITFIPIANNSLKERGFNQCEYIAREIGFRAGFTVIDTLKKVKETEIQKTLRKEERLKNIVGAFKVINRKTIQGKKIILIDDVITTGATLNEGIRVLKESGALEIKILTLAKSNI